MAQTRCRSCLGVFEADQRDGTRYFHACPLQTRVHVTRAGVEQDVALTDVRATDLITVLRGGALVGILPPAMQAADLRTGDTFVEWPNKRDENVRIVDHDKAGNPIAAPKHEGAGVDRL